MESTLIIHIVYNIIIIIEQLLSYNTEGRPRSIIQAITALFIWIYEKCRPTKQPEIMEITSQAEPPTTSFDQIKHLV
jgi:hypothetical protein